MFKPGDLKSQKIRVNIGTAGSTTLILQALMIPATQIKIEAEITGGTDNPFAPPADYLINVTAPILAKLGYSTEIKLLRRGHHPIGQGRIYFKSIGFEPKQLNLTDRGEMKVIRGRVHCTRLSEDIAHRELRAAKTILLNSGVLNLKIQEEIDDNGTPGTGVVLWAEFENSVMGASSLGELRKRAEIVGKEAAENLLAEIDSNQALDSHMVDQIIPYLALVGGEVTVSKVTQHALTCAKICELFLDKKIQIKGELNKIGRISVK